MKKNKDLENNKSICIASGGTGGHIFPALVTAEHLIENGYKVLFITDERFHNYGQYFQEIIQHEHFQLVTIKARRGGKSIIKTIIALFSFFASIYKSFCLLKIHKIKVTVGFGSYTALPVIIASSLREVPSVIHEQNSYMGLGNRISALFARKVMTSFPETYGFFKMTLKKAVLCGMPLRKSIRELYYTNTNSNINYNAYFRTSDRVNILILGGSQGAGIFSKVLPDVVKYLDEDIVAKLFIYHQARYADIDKVASEYKALKIRYHVNAFFQDVGELMTMSHLVISRSGANSLFDLAACGSPSLFVPYKNAKNNHQMLNAKYFYKKGGCLLIDEDSFTADKVANVIQSLVYNDRELLDLSISIKTLASLNAHEKIKEQIDKILRKNGDITPLDKSHKSVNTGDVGIG